MTASGTIAPEGSAPPRPCVLVVDEARELRALVERNLRENGYDVLLAADGQEALRKARRERPDLVLLDLALPDLSGLDLCRTLKADFATRHVPLIVVSASDDEMDRVVSFELGASDYVLKPFSLRELVLRVRAVLGRQGPTLACGRAPVRSGLLRIDRDARRVWVGDREVALTSIELRLLLVLYERRDRVQPRAQLLCEIWGTAAARSSRTIDTHLRRLRAKLGPAAEYIRTIRCVGYRFTSPDDSA